MTGSSIDHTSIDHGSIQRGVSPDEAAMERTRRIPHWDAAMERTHVLISGESDVACALALGFRGLGAQRVTLLAVPDAGPRGRLRGLLDGWLDDVDVTTRTCPSDAESLRFLLSMARPGVVVQVGEEPAELASVAAEMSLPAYRAEASGSRFHFRLSDRSRRSAGAPTGQPVSSEEVGSGNRGSGESRGASRTVGAVDLSTCFALSGFLSHDFGRRFIITDSQGYLPSGTCSFDLADPWGVEAGSARALPSGILERAQRVLVVGAGGLGCPILVDLGSRLPAGSSVVVCDPDHVDPTNRNRQFLFSAADAEARVPKAATACEKLSAVYPDVRWVAIDEAFSASRLEGLAPFDVVFAVTDSHASRLEIARSGIAPLFAHAAVNDRSASAVLFHPESVRVEEALSLAHLAREETGRASCGAAGVEPSIISTNFVGAALAVSRFVRHAAYGPAEARVLAYELTNDNRGGAWPPFERSAGGPS